MYKYCKNILPPTFNNMFTTNANNHDFETDMHLILNFPTTSSCYQGVKIWNNIPYMWKIQTKIYPLSNIPTKIFLLLNINRLSKQYWRLRLDRPFGLFFSPPPQCSFITESDFVFYVVILYSSYVEKLIMLLCCWQLLWAWHSTLKDIFHPESDKNKIDLLIDKS